RVFNNLSIYDGPEKLLPNQSLKNMNVLSISNTGRNLNSSAASGSRKLSFEMITKICREAEKFLITVPIGYDKVFDDLLVSSEFPFFILERINVKNEWKVRTDKSLKYEFNFPYAGSNALYVITNLSFYKELNSDKLNLGCGNDYREGWVNVDIGNCKKDIEYDLEVLPLPFEDNSFNYILMQHVMEHIERKNFPNFMRELHRISKPGAIIHIESPYFNSKNAWTDFTHKNFITEETFGYFDNSHHLRHLGIIYNLNFTFKTLGIALGGPSDNLTIVFDLQTEK
ncbi:MAG: class I SAM-dependent methyltransferase, partial [Syntrophothermus sp.]